MNKHLDEFDQHMELMDAILGPEQSKNRETLFEYNFGRDTRPDSYRQGREFFRVEITTRNFYHNPLRLQWFYHSDNRREKWKLTSLSFRGMGLPHIETGVFLRFNNLEYLDLQGNQLLEFDFSTLKNTKGLHTVNLSSNLLKVIDLEPLKNIANLRSLNLFNNRLEKLDIDQLVSCKELNRINLEKNNLKEINLEPLSHLKYLITLDISHNQLTQSNLIPSNGFLRHLILNDNLLQNLEVTPSIVGSLEDLTLLNVSNNQLTALPLDLLCQLRNINKIYAWGNCISTVKINCQETSLVELNLNSNLITRAEISGRYHDLEVLELAYNQIIRLDLTDSELKNLRELNLAMNPLGELHVNIDELPNLEKIDIFGCGLPTLTLPSTYIVKSQIKNKFGDRELVELICLRGDHQLLVYYSTPTEVVFAGSS